MAACFFAISHSWYDFFVLMALGLRQQAARKFSFERTRLRRLAYSDFGSLYFCNDLGFLSDIRGDALAKPFGCQDLPGS